MEASFTIPMRWQMKINIYNIIYIGAIGDEENQQNVDVFTMPNLLN